jgi:hypothetical protein
LTTNSWTRKEHCTGTIWKTAESKWHTRGSVWRCGGPTHEHCVGENDKGRAVQSLVVKKKIEHVPGTSEFIPKWVVSVSCSHLFACLHEPAEATYHLLVCHYGTGMCKECDAIGKVLPSLESFRQWWNLPKIYFVFYDYFLKSVIQESVWIDRVNTPSSGMGARLGQSFLKLTHLPRLKITTFHGCISSRLNIQTTLS